VGGAEASALSALRQIICDRQAAIPASGHPQ
jgi:hypothetical protein